MAAFSSARSAYIRFSLAFSASSSRNRVTSETLAPPYLREEGGLADAVRPQEVVDGHAGLSIFQDANNLGLAELRLPHHCSLTGAVYFWGLLYCPRVLGQWFDGIRF